MTYHDHRPLSSLCTLGLALALACNPGGGDDTSGASTTASSGDASTSGTTTTATTGPTTSESDATSTSTSDATSTSTSDATTTTSTTDATSTTATTGDTTTDDTTGSAVGCAEDPEFTASWNAWQTAVLGKGDTYFYTVLRGAEGFQPPDFCIYRTLVAVTDGVVSERRFDVSGKVGDPPECDAAFIEQGAEIGTHDSSYAAVPATVDALYAACCDEVIHIEPADEYMVTFNTDKQGLMQECYYIINSCADGCDGGPLGATLSFESLTFGAPPPAP